MSSYLEQKQQAESWFVDKRDVVLQEQKRTSAIDEDSWKKPVQVGGLPDHHLFEHLVNRWRADTRLLSSTTAIVTHQAYQRIIGLGASIIPYICADLERRPGQWDWALRALTGNDPVPETDAGDMRAVAKHWLNWARAEGYGW